MIAGSTTIRLLADITDVLRKFGQVTGEAQKTSRGVQSAFADMGSAMKNALAGIGIAALTHQMGQMADAVTSMRNGLVLATGSVEKANDAYYKLFNIAQQSRVSFVELGNTFGSISRAGDGLGLTQGQLLIVTESLGNAMAVSGGTAQGMQAAMMQLSQGLASGVLRGEELNSVMEQTPRVARALADGLGVPIGQLRKMGEAGELTAERVIGALMSQSEVLRREVQGAVMTMGQAFVLTMNSATLLVGEIDRVTGASAQVSAEMRGVSDAASGIAMAFLEVESAGNRVSLTGGVIRVVFEALAVLAVNVAFTFRMVGQEIGGIAAQAHAFLTGGMDGVRAIRGMMIADAQAARAEVDALSERIVNSSALAAQARAEAEAARKKELERIPQMIQEMELRRAQAQSSARRAATSATRSMQGDEFAAERAAAQEWARAWEDFAQMVRQAENETLGLSKAQERLKTFLTSPAYQNMSEPMRQLVIEQAQAAIGAEQAAAAHAEQVRALEEVTKAEAARIQEMERSAQTVQERLQALRDEDEAAEMAARQNIALAEAVELVAIARLRERQAIERLMGNDRAVEAIEREIVARRELGAVMRERAGRDLSRAAAEEAEQNWRRTSESIENSLTDALMRGFESGKGFARNLRDTVVNMFRTMVLRPIIQAVVAPVAAVVTGALGFGGAAHAAGQASDAIGMASGIRGVYDTIVGGFTRLGDSVAFAANDIGQWLVSNTTGVLNRFGGSLMGNASSLGTIGSYLGGAGVGLGLGNLISGQFAAFGNANVSNIGGTAIGAIFGGPIGAAIGGAIGGLINRAFGRGPVQTTGTGITGTFGTGGADVQAYQDWTQRGGWFRRSRGGRNMNAITPELDRFLDDALTQITDATRAHARILGLNADAINGITQQINISLMGLSAEQQQERIAQALAGFADHLASVYGVTVRGGETASQALSRLATSLATVNAVFDTLNHTLMATSLAGGDAASKLLDAFGGAEAFVQATSAFYDAFYTEAERTATATRQLTETLAGMGMALPATRDAYRALVEAQDLNTEAGRQAYVTLLRLAPAFVKVTDAAGELAGLLGRTVAAAATEAISLIDRQIEQSREAASAARDVARAYRDAAADLSATMRSLIFDTHADQGAGMAYASALSAARGGDVEAMRALPNLASAYAAQATEMATSRAQATLISAQIAAQLGQVAAVAEVMGLGADYQAMLYDVNTAILDVLRTDLQTGDLTVSRLTEIRDALGVVGSLISSSGSLTVAAVQTMDGRTVGALVDTSGRVAAQVSNSTVQTLAGLTSHGASLGGGFAASISGQTAQFGQFTNQQIAGLASIDGGVSETVTLTDLVAQTTGTNSRLSEAILRQLQTPDAGSRHLSDIIAAGNTLLAGRVEGVIAAINQQSAAQQAALQRQQDLARAQSDLESYAGFASSRHAVIRAAAPTHDTPGGTNDAAWENIVRRQWDAHVARFGVGWNTRRTAPHERAANLAFMQDQWAAHRMAQEQSAINQQIELLRQRVRDLGGVPAFATGGLHSGGLRIVGEHGPELEATGPSRIYSASQTAAILGGGGDVAQEVRALREELGLLRAEARATASNTGKTKRLLERVTRDGEAMQTVGAAP